MQAAEQVVAHAGGAWDASLNLYPVGGDLVATQQVDDYVYVVGQDSFDIARYRLAEWVGGTQPTDVASIECDDATMAWDMLRLLRQDCLV